MRKGKIVTFLVLLGLGYQYQEMAVEQARFIYDIFPLAQTYLEMTSYSSGLRTYIRSRGEFPTDLSGWLSENYKTKTGKPAGKDFFKTRYQGNLEDGYFVLRSCGRDKDCFTDDDVLMKIAKDRSGY